MEQDNRRGRVDDLIDANLRSVYDSILREEVPSCFTDLLARLGERERGGGAPGGDGSGDAPSARRG